jgi:hypothetical protein
MKLFVLAGMATVFAGMASAQLLCTTATANAVFVRSESNDDQVADTTVTCSVPAANLAIAAGTVNMTVYLSPSVNITSFNVGTSSTPKSEAIAGLTASFVAGGGAPFVPGSVSGNSVTFSGITIGALAAGSPAFTLTITNIKIQSSTVATGTGVPTGISETIFVSGTNTTPSAITTGSAVAYVTSGLSGIKTSGTTSNALCNATTTYNSAGALAPNFTVTFAEAFPNSFKVQGSTAANNALGTWYTNHSETGVGVTGYTNSNVATSGTRIKIIYNNVPANVAIFMPLTFTGTNGGVVKLTTSETGAFAAPTGATANGNPNALLGGSNVAGDGSTASLTVTSGSATAIYEDTTFSTAPATFAIPVYLQASAGAVPAPASAITATVSFAPIGATSNVPNFINGASTTTVNGSTFAACSTTLLFPFVTNQAGFESGLAISNTGADLLATKNGAPITSVTGQSGTCLLTFFGNATASSNPPAFTTAAAVAPGTSWTGTLTSVTGGTPNTFGGYMIAQCNFLYAHGFTYITYNIGQSSGMAMGYLALAVNTPRTNSTAINVSGAVGGAVSTAAVGVSSANPEQLGN